MDLRVEQIFWEEMKDDKSFHEKDHTIFWLLGGTKYTKEDMREVWQRGVKHGIEIGLTRASLDGQIVDLNRNAENKRHIEFLEKYYALSAEYGCAIQYHPKCGMVVIDKNNEQWS